MHTVLSDAGKVGFDGMKNLVADSEYQVKKQALKTLNKLRNRDDLLPGQRESLGSLIKDACGSGWIM